MAHSKGIRTLALGAALFSLLFTTALAVPTHSKEGDTAQTIAYANPRWTQASRVDPSISVSGSTVTVKALVQAKSDSVAITGTAYLEKKSGTSWSSVESWSISATGKILFSQSYANASKGEYRVRVSVTVAGESISVISGNCTL